MTTNGTSHIGTLIGNLNNYTVNIAVKELIPHTAKTKRYIPLKKFKGILFI